MFVLPEYEWRGKRYKSVSGLFKGVQARYPGMSLGFDEHAMVLRNNSGQELRFVREFAADGHSVIAELPQ